MNNKFTKWFMRAYKQWCKKEVGEEDFIGFCFELGYPPYQVLDWHNGNAVPSGSKVLNIAGLLGIEVYNVLGLEKPDQELLDIFDKFFHLQGEYRANLTQKIYQIEKRLSDEGLLLNSQETIDLISETLQDL